jgi:hypothetical protein
MSSFFPQNEFVPISSSIGVLVQVNVYNMGVYSRQGVEKSLQGVTLNEFASHSPVPPTVPDMSFSLDFRLSR